MVVRFFTALVFLLGFWCISSASAQKPQLSFRHAQAGYAFEFPRDHASHQGFQTEWWYYTGQLYDVDAQPFRDPPRYGFQLTFFRRQESPAPEAMSEYLAHAALTDLKTGVTHFSSRKGGALLGAAGSDRRTLEVWSGEWLAEAIGESHVLRFSPVKGSDIQVRLTGVPQAAPWLQGSGGYSKKGSCETCASHYYSFARIPFKGEVRTAAGISAVHGLGWMDHEFMSNTLSPDQVGWDWMGLMLQDGRSLTVFRLRDPQGRTSFASASILTGDKSENVLQDAITLTPSDEWTSPTTKGRYPLAWRVQIPSHLIDITVRARTPACELGEGTSDLEPRYWEGPVASSDEGAIGYLEMTGYVGKVRL